MPFRRAVLANSGPGGVPLNLGLGVSAIEVDIVNANPASAPFDE
jgi:hypothetical protein